MGTEASERPYRRSKVVGSELGDEIVFFDDRIGKYFAIGRVGADIWKMLDSPRSLDEIATVLITQYEVDQDTCRTETKNFLEQMIAVGLIELG